MFECLPIHDIEAVQMLERTEKLCRIEATPPFVELAFTL